MDVETHNEYCELVFSIFEALEIEIGKQKIVENLLEEKTCFRVFGYLGEVLTNAFIIYCKGRKKIKEVAVLYLDN